MVWPGARAILGPLLAVLTRQADTSLTVPEGWQYAPQPASTVLTTIVGATVGLAGLRSDRDGAGDPDGHGTFSARYMRI